jgi:hypothetical protein
MEFLCSYVSFQGFYLMLVYRLMGHLPKYCVYRRANSYLMYDAGDHVIYGITAVSNGVRYLYICLRQ